jgi:WD repeat-containing protein 19
VTGAWSDNNLIGLGSEDRTISISDSEGDTLKVISMRADPSDLQFVQVKSEERATPDTMVLYFFIIFFLINFLNKVNLMYIFFSF